MDVCESEFCVPIKVEKGRIKKEQMKDGKNELREKKESKRKERKGIDVIVKMKVILLFTVPQDLHKCQKAILIFWIFISLFFFKQ